MPEAAASSASTSASQVESIFDIISFSLDGVRSLVCRRLGRGGAQRDSAEASVGEKQQSRSMVTQLSQHWASTVTVCWPCSHSSDIVYNPAASEESAIELVQPWSPRRPKGNGDGDSDDIALDELDPIVLPGGRETIDQEEQKTGSSSDAQPPQLELDWLVFAPTPVIDCVSLLR